MIVQQDAGGGISGEELLLEFLGEKLRAGNDDGFVFLAGPQVDEPQGGNIFVGHGRFHEHRGIMDVAGEQVREHFVHRDFGAGAKFR